VPEALLMSLCCAVLLLGLASAAAADEPETLLSVSFGQDAWSPADWVIAKNPTVPHLGAWVQRPTCIENETPADPALAASLDHTLTTMVYARQFAGDLTVSATLEFGAGAAPGIVVAQTWAPDEEGRPQYGEFYEVIIYEQGLNLWHHFPRDGEPTYELAAYARFPLKPDTPYKLTAQRKGQTLEMSVDGHQVGVLIPPLAPELFLGLEGCEGICRATDFAVTR
jgi:hypothetical protein